MPKINFQEAQNPMAPMPIGTYICEIVEVKEKKTQRGEDYFALRLEVVGGDYEGRPIYDNIFFSERALKRLKLICERLEIGTKGDIEITPDTFSNLKVNVLVKQDTYTNKEGRLIIKNIVAYDGYNGIVRVEEQSFRDYISDDEVPF